MIKHGGGHPESERSPKVVHITRARRLAVRARPETEPPCEMKGIWNAGISERSRAILVQGELRLDMGCGDPFGRILRKANYAAENGPAALNSEEARNELALGLVRVIADFGEPEGMRLVRRIREIYQGSETLDREISGCVSRIGHAADLDVILGCLDGQRGPAGPHLSAMLALAERYPDSCPLMLEALERRRSIPGTEQAIEALRPQAK